MTSFQIRCSCGNEFLARVQWKTRSGNAVVLCSSCGRRHERDPRVAEFWERYAARRLAALTALSERNQ
jgi:transcription elongation factor Elf1